MYSLTSNETRHAESLAEIKNCPALAARWSEEEIARPLSAIFAGDYRDEWEGVEFGDRMIEYSLRFNELGAFWYTLDERPDLPGIKGEFSLINFHDALRSSDPGPRWGTTDFHREFLGQLCPIDRTPRSGAGVQTYLRLQEDVPELEIWYSDIANIGNPPYPPGFIRLDINYCQYLDALILTKGTFGWQYLFAEQSLGGGEFSEIARYLENMLQVFPELFPAHDYSSLLPRLEARL
ncbi:hypothetical protein ACWGRV_14740 [Streptomyces sp. NPDC055663]